MNIAKNIVGARFNKLTVISRIITKNTKEALWRCKCDCGAMCDVTGSSLRSGHTKSCGCLRGKKYAVKVGAKCKEYRAFLNIKSRCCNPLDKGYKRYGGRGIQVCDRWINSYENFISDMGKAPSPNHSIERMDNNGNYEPGNCRWATNKEQANNRRTTIRITLNNTTKSLKQWCEIFNTNYITVRSRIKFLKWEPIDALSTPIITRNTKSYAS